MSTGCRCCSCAAMSSPTAGPTRSCSRSRTSRERSGKGELAAEAVLAQVKGAIDGKLLQVGGDATTGRGLVSARVQPGVGA